METSFLGVDKATWDLFNSFANWFAGIGSLAAAWVALYIANRYAKPSALVSVGHRVMVTHGNPGPYPEFIVFRIVNTGDRPIKISQIGWRTGSFRKGLLRRRYCIQLFEHTLSSPLHIELYHGQEASWMIPLVTQTNVPWPEYFVKDFITPGPHVLLWMLRAQFFSSVGHIFEAKPDNTLIKLFREACRKINMPS